MKFDTCGLISRISPLNSFLLSGAPVSDCRVARAHHDRYGKTVVDIAPHTHQTCSAMLDLGSRLLRPPLDEIRFNKASYSSLQLRVIFHRLSMHDGLRSLEDPLVAASDASVDG